MREIADNNTTTGTEGTSQGGLGSFPLDTDRSTKTEGTTAFPNRQCRNPYCTNNSKLGSNYCRKHTPSLLGSEPSRPMPVTPETGSRSARADIKQLEEQIAGLEQMTERLEAKLDALLMALDVEGVDQ